MKLTEEEAEFALSSAISEQMKRLEARAPQGFTTDAFGHVTVEAAKLQALVTADATHRLNVAITKATNTIVAAAESFANTTAASEKQLARWTLWQAFSTIVLAGFTIAQVIVFLWYPNR